MTAPLAAFVPLALSTALGLTGLVLLAATPRSTIPLGSLPEETVGYFVMQLAFAIVGALVARRRPENSIGWVLGAVALASSVQFASIGYGLYGLYGTTALPAPEIALWIYSWAGVTVALFGVWIVFTFPDGRLLTRRAGAGFGILALGGVLVIVSFMFRPGPLLYLPRVVNPLGRPQLAEPLETAGVVGAALFVVAFLLGTATIRERYASARGTERQQLKWFLGGLVLLGLVMIPALPFALELAGGPVVRYSARLAAALALTAVPISIGIAILRYRLYDIDVLINRTLVYGALSATLLATYVLSVLALSALLRPLTGSSDLAVAGSTLAVVAAFGPLRARIQRAVDHRFSRSRYDAARTLDAFSVRLRDEVDLDAVRADLLGAVHDTVRPAHASVWLRDQP
ncbi:MAG: hypothetical protein H0T09_06645 [Actinobacteria bacterium]|nr:hypothetical protein [Actinomycetota bacterium]